MISSLGRTVPPFTLCRAEWCRRALATSAYAETPSPSPMPPKISKTHAHNGRVNSQDTPPRLFVRPWDGVPSMPDGFAMLRGIEKKYGKIKAFNFIRDGENPSTYFSYFWVELEDPSRYSDATTTVLQIPIPQIQRKRPGGIGIADIQPFLRPSLQAQQEAHEWTGVTERMIDEVDESKRAVKVYDLRIEPSYITAKRPQRIGPSKPHLLTQAFVKWGGFAPSLPQGPGTTGPSVRPTFDNLVKRATQSNKPEQKTVITGDEIPSPVEEPHKPFNYEFDEPAPSAEVWTPASSQANTDSSAKPQSLLTMQREGKQLSKKQKALLQAAAISRTPLPSFEAKTLSEAEKDGREATKSEATPESTDEEKKEIQNRVWDLVKGKWF